MAQRSARIGSTRNAVEIRQITRGTNSAGVQVRIDYTKIAPPDQYYVADYARIESHGAIVQIIFGKLEGIGGGQLRNKLEVNIPAYAFRSQWIASSAFFEVLRQGSVRGLYPEYEPSSDVREFTEKVQTVHSNNTLITNGGSECCIDLYYLSPRDVRNSIDNNDDAQVEALVRVIVESSILAWLSKSFERISDEIDAFAPKDDIAEHEVDEVE